MHVSTQDFTCKTTRQKNRTENKRNITMNAEIFENFFKTTVFKTKPNSLILSAVDYAAAENEIEKDEAKFTSSAKWLVPASVNFAKANKETILKNLLPAKVSKRKRALAKCAWDFVLVDETTRRGITGILHDVKNKKIVATDHKIMYICDLQTDDAAEQSFVEFRDGNKDFDVFFPDWKSVVPRLEVMQHYDMSADKISLAAGFCLVAKNFYKITDNSHYMPISLDDDIGVFKAEDLEKTFRAFLDCEEKTMRIYYKDDLPFVVFEGTHIQILLMSLRGDIKSEFNLLEKLNSCTPKFEEYKKIDIQETSIIIGLKENPLNGQNVAFSEDEKKHFSDLFSNLKNAICTILLTAIGERTFDKKDIASKIPTTFGMLSTKATANLLSELNELAKQLKSREDCIKSTCSIFEWMERVNQFWLECTDEEKPFFCIRNYKVAIGEHLVTMHADESLINSMINMEIYNFAVEKVNKFEADFESAVKSIPPDSGIIAQKHDGKITFTHPALRFCRRSIEEVQNELEYRRREAAQKQAEEDRKRAEDARKRAKKAADEDLHGYQNALNGITRTRVIAFLAKEHDLPRNKDGVYGDGTYKTYVEQLVSKGAKPVLYANEYKLRIGDTLYYSYKILNDYAQWLIDTGWKPTVPPDDDPTTPRGKNDESEELAAPANDPASEHANDETAVVSDPENTNHPSNPADEQNADESSATLSEPCKLESVANPPVSARLPGNSDSVNPISDNKSPDSDNAAYCDNQHRNIHADIPIQSRYSGGSGGSESPIPDVISRPPIPGTKHKKSDCHSPGGPVKRAAGMKFPRVSPEYQLTAGNGKNVLGKSIYTLPIVTEKAMQNGIDSLPDDNIRLWVMFLGHFARDSLCSYPVRTNMHKKKRSHSDKERSDCFYARNIHSGYFSTSMTAYGSLKRHAEWRRHNRLYRYKKQHANSITQYHTRFFCVIKV